MNIQESVKLFHEHIVLTQSLHTARSYLTAVESFLEYLKTEKIAPTDDTTLLTVRRFIGFPSYLFKKKYTKVTISLYLSGMKRYYDWLVTEQLVPLPNYQDTLSITNVLKDARRKRSNKFIRFPEKGQDEQMIAAVLTIDEPSPIRERDIALVRFLYSSGCRNAEVAGLVIDKLDMTERSAVVTGKGDKDRRVYFDKATAEALQEYWKARGWSSPSDPVFARHDKGTGKKHQLLTTKSVWNIVDEVRKLADIPAGKFSPHWFRHAFAIKMLRATGNLALVQDLLGHKNAESTRVYAKIYTDDLRDAHHEIYG